jgi:hypothetical protein
MASEIRNSVILLTAFAAYHGPNVYEAAGLRYFWNGSKAGDNGWGRLYRLEPG